MANTVWKGQLTFGLVSFPVHLLRAARKERVPLRYVREVKQFTPDPEELEDLPIQTPLKSQAIAPGADRELDVAPVRQAYFADPMDEPVPSKTLQRGYQVAPDQYVVLHTEELQRLRPATSPDLQILRSVRMREIDPVFLETSYYVVPDAGGEHSYSLFYQALRETQYAALAQVAMHGREHILIIRAANKGLIAHTMYYMNEVRQSTQYSANPTEVVGKELDLAKRFVEAIAEPFRPEEFTDRYREQLEALIASKDAARSVTPAAGAQNSSGKVVDIMEALRKSLEKATAAKSPPPRRKSVSAAPAPETKARKRKA